MSKKLYVGNLNFSTDEEGLNSLFSQFGQVLSARIVKDRVTLSSKGFGFVEMAEDSDAEKAVASLNGREVDGRKIRVNEAMEKRQRNPEEDGEKSSYDKNRRKGGFHRRNFSESREMKSENHRNEY